MPRTALLIRCDTEDANRIRNEARLQRTTISSYVLQALLRAIESDERGTRAGSTHDLRRSLQRQDAAPAVSRTAILVRCEDTDAEQIRYEAKRNALALNAFVIQSLKKVWKV